MESLGALCGSRTCSIREVESLPLVLAERAKIPVPEIASPPARRIDITPIRLPGLQLMVVASLGVTARTA
jgi:hypothetical protein